MDYFITEINEQQIKAEKDKAREIRKSRWWSNRVDKGLCYYCGNSFQPQDLTMDHIVPIIRGGKTTRGNLVPACKECNNQKKYLIPIEWDEYLKRIEAKGV
jgi:5-methylcytosine-specific restriction endonuclease McrA